MKLSRLYRAPSPGGGQDNQAAAGLGMHDASQCRPQRSYPLDRRWAEQPTRHGKQNDQDDQERDRVLILRGDVAGGKSLEQSEQQSADHRSDSTADAAEHGGGETFERQHGADVVARERDGSDQDARHRADRGRNRKGQGNDGARIDADETGGEFVRGGRDPRPARQSALDERPQQHDDDHRSGEHYQALRQDGSTADADRIAADKRRQAVKAFVEYHLRDATQKDRRADGDDQQNDCTAGAHRFHGATI